MCLQTAWEFSFKDSDDICLIDLTYFRHFPSFPQCFRDWIFLSFQVNIEEGETTIFSVEIVFQNTKNKSLIMLSKVIKMDTAPFT